MSKVKDNQLFTTNNIALLKQYFDYIGDDYLVDTLNYRANFLFGDFEITDPLLIDTTINITAVMNKFKYQALLKNIQADLDYSAIIKRLHSETRDKVTSGDTSGSTDTTTTTTLGTKSDTETTTTNTPDINVNSSETTNNKNNVSAYDAIALSTHDEQVNTSDTNTTTTGSDETNTESTTTNSGSDVNKSNGETTNSYTNSDTEKYDYTYTEHNLEAQARIWESLIMQYSVSIVDVIVSDIVLQLCVPEYNFDDDDDDDLN